MWKIVKTDSQLQETVLITFGDVVDACNWLETTAKAFNWRFARNPRGYLFNGYFVDALHNSYEVM